MTGQIIHSRVVAGKVTFVPLAKWNIVAKVSYNAFEHFICWISRFSRVLPSTEMGDSCPLGLLHWAILISASRALPVFCRIEPIRTWLAVYQRGKTILMTALSYFHQWTPSGIFKPNQLEANNVLISIPSISVGPGTFSSSLYLGIWLIWSLSLQTRLSRDELMRSHRIISF